MKKGIKIYLLIVSTFIIIGIQNVFAYNATGYRARANEDLKYKYGGNFLTYEDGEFVVNFQSKQYSAYCIDPGFHMGIVNKTDLTCSPLNNKAINAILSIAKRDGNNHEAIQLALRMVARNGSIAKDPAGASEKENPSEAIKELADRVDSGRRDFSDLFIGNDSQVNLAIDYYIRAKNACGGNLSNCQSNSSRTISNYLNYSYRSSSSSGGTYTATYDVTSISNTSLKNVNFQCSTSGCSVTRQEWNGKSGTVTVQLGPNKGCKFTISACYDIENNNPGDENPGDGNSDNDGDSISYICSGSAIDQNLIIDYTAILPGSSNNIDSNNGTPGEIQPGNSNINTCTNPQTNTFNVKGGNEYYEAYCKNYCDPDDLKPTVSIPEYCDDSTGKEMSITETDKIKSCILDNDTYKDTSLVSGDNPYCAVYCKEDFHMQLPGAQYTNSGQYFSLTDTVVKGTRTCYATGNESQDGIDIEQYNQDMIDAQKALVSAYNEYSKKKAIFDNIGNASTSETKDCAGNTYVKYTLNKVSYTSYTISNCSESTGKCTITANSSETSATWGDSVTTSNGTSEVTVSSASEKTAKEGEGYTCGDIPTNGVATCTKATCTNNFSAHVDTPTAPSNNAINNATSKLNKHINSFKQCYNWENKYSCFGPTVEFDYKEQYSRDIQFKQKGNIEENISGKTYGTEIINDKDLTGGGSITTQKYISCTESGCDSQGNIAENISLDIRYIEQKNEKTAKYNNIQNFATNYPHGTIDKLSSADLSNLRENYSYLGAVFPIALKTERGVYNWTLNFKNLGQYGNDSSCRMGRLNDAVEASGATDSADIGYVCVYVVDCPDCPYECSCPENLPDGYTCVQRDQFTCEIIPDGPDPKCPDCDVYCVNCIFDGDDTYNYRTVSLSNLSPNNTIGVNWQSRKGQATKEAIEESNEQAYKKPEYSYTITPAQMKKIRDYNNQKGTYVADDLTYHQQNNVNNAYGTSEFLDDGNRIYFTENKRNEEWTLWTGEINTNGSGPAWK